MRVSSASRRKGTQHETAIVNYLRELGYDAERLRLSGRDDEGDVVAKCDDVRVVIEAKAERSIDLASYVDEARRERDNYCKKRGLDPATVDAVAVVKRRNKGIAEAYVVTSLNEFFD